MKRTHWKHKLPFLMLFPLFFSFLLGVAGGWYAAQKGLLPWQNLSLFSLPAVISPQKLTGLELNNTPEQATLIRPGVEVQGTLITGRDVDFLKFTVDVPSRVQIALMHLPNEYQMYVYSPNKELIAVSQRRGFLDTTSIFSAPDKGIYIIRIFANYSETATLPYKLKVTLLPF